MKQLLVLIAGLLALALCREEEAASGDQPVRGLKAHLVTARPNVATRHKIKITSPGLGQADGQADFAVRLAVLSDQCELVSARTVTLSLMPRKDRATRSERRRGWP